jgi:hypothetical protein
MFFSDLDLEGEEGQWVLLFPTKNILLSFFFTCAKTLNKVFYFENKFCESFFLTRVKTLSRDNSSIIIAKML